MTNTDTSDQLPPRPRLAPHVPVCPEGWGDFGCAKPKGHDGPHSFAWVADEDEE